MAAITRKALIFALVNTANLDSVAAELNADTTDIQAAIDTMVKALNRPHKSKSSAETLANKENTELLVAELNARDGEFTAAEVADMTTDREGNTMNPRKVGSLLSRAAKAGLIAKSPEPWSVAHYAHNGFKFAKKPGRKDKAKANAEE